MYTFTFSGLGETQYAAMARAQAQLNTQARQRANTEYNVRNWKPDPVRVRAQPSARSNLPAFMTDVQMEDLQRRRAEATAKTSAALQQMFRSTPGPGAGQRVLNKSGYNPQRLSASAQRLQDARILARARAEAQVRMREQAAILIPQSQAEGARRAAMQVDPREVIVPSAPPPHPMPTPDIVMPTRTGTVVTEITPPIMQNSITRQSTADLQRLVDARRKLGIQ